MTIVNAANATEAVNITLVSDQFDFDTRDPGGVNSVNDYSWRSSGGDDVQATGQGIDFNGNPPAFGTATQIDFDLSNNSFSNPDVTMTGITRQTGGGALSPARLAEITAGALDFSNEVLSVEDTLIGGDFDDVFKAAGGDDDLSMGDGDDSAFGDAGDDVISGEDDDDDLFGGAGADTLSGGDGDDLLNGGTDADDMDGGFGDDVYVVDNAGDVAAEVAGGVDRVEASVTESLSANIENLTLTGVGDINGTGNSRVNVINGNAGNNDLFGGGGDDALIGLGGDDLLDGGTGADNMNGGTGDDTFVVDDAGDNTFEGFAAGVDEVRASITRTLAPNVENLTLTGAAATDGTGNGLANSMTGNGAANILLGLGGADQLFGGSGGDTLNGGSGADLLRGGGGADILVGGTGFDIFDFNAVSESGPGAASRDVINGFDNPGAVAGDVIDLASIDANVTGGAGGNQAFAFLGQIQNPNPPATAAGSLWLRSEGGETVAYANVDGDNAAEMAIRIADGAVVPGAYGAADFVL